MKLTIAPTESNEYQWSVSVETPRDDLNVEQVVELISRCMLAFGFSDKNVRDFLKEIAENA